MALRCYVLDDQGNPVPCDVLTWGRWMEAADTYRLRTIAKDRDEGPGADPVEVSTVFLGLDHNYRGSGPPVLWETLVFGGPLDGTQRRYDSRDAALRGHQAICRLVRKSSKR